MLHQTKLLSLLTVSALFMTLGASAQSLGGEVTPAPATVLDAFELTAGTIQDVVPMPGTSGGYDVVVTINGLPRTLLVQPYDVRSPNYQLLVDDGVSLTRVETPPSVTYRGTVAGEYGSGAAISIIDGQVHGVVFVEDATWGIEPVSSKVPGTPATAHVVYMQANTRVDGSVCGTEGQSAPVSGDAGGAGIDVIEEAEIAIDCDFQYYSRNGATVPTTEAAATTVVNGMDFIYQRDVEVAFRITTIVVRTVAVTAYTNASSASGLLNAFRNNWNTNHTNIQRDLAHLFSGKSTFGGILGIASLGVLCNRSSAYGVSWVMSVGGQTRKVGLVSHEVGHNCNANHCDGINPCNIMCSGLGGCNNNLTSFGAWAANAITNFKNSRTCLTPFAQDPPTITSLSQTSQNSYNQLLPQVVMTGTELDSVVSVDVGPGQANIVSKTSTSLTFTLPNGFAIGTHQLVANNNTGSSNAVPYTVTGTNPPVFVGPGIHTTGTTQNYTIYTDLGHSVPMFLSASNAPSVLPGIASFSIGANFTNFLFLITLPADSGGVANLPLNIPVGAVPPLTTLYYQAISYTGTPVAPLTTTNAIGVLYF